MASPTPAPFARDRRIDLLRGAALVFIFFDHVPGSLLGHLTPRNLGFSDAAEWFVLLAGCAAMLAYGRSYLQRGLYVTSLLAVRRAGVLYVAHVFLLSVLMALVFVANDQVVTRDFVAETGLGYFLQQPQQALIAGLLLTFKPMLMDPLPLYIVLVLLVPALVPALVHRPRTTAAASFALYLVANLTDLNFPSRPEGYWFFNPLAWQFLFVLGGLLVRSAVVAPAERVETRLPRPVVVAAVAFLVLSAALALSWRWPSLHDAVMPLGLAKLLYPISKTDLAPLRLLHVLALAVCATRLLRPAARLDGAFASGLALLGRHALHVFCAGVLLAPVADAINALNGDAAAVQVLTGLGGVAVMLGTAAVLEEYARLRRSGRRSAEPVAQAVRGRATPGPASPT